MKRNNIWTQTRSQRSSLEHPGYAMRGNGADEECHTATQHLEKPNILGISGASPITSGKWGMHAAPSRVQKTHHHQPPITNSVFPHESSGGRKSSRVKLLQHSQGKGTMCISWESSGWWNSLEKPSPPCVGILLSALWVPWAINEAEPHKGPLRAEWGCPHEKYTRNSYLHFKFTPWLCFTILSLCRKAPGFRFSFCPYYQ